VVPGGAGAFGASPAKALGGAMGTGKGDPTNV